MKKYTKLVFILLMFFALASAIVPNSVYSDQIYKNWGLRKKVVLSRYLTKGDHISFRADAKPGYENKILNYIIAIDGSLKKKIEIIRSKGAPQRDYLMVNNKLYSVLEDYGYITNANLKKIISNLSKKYKKPTIQNDRNMVIYSFFSRHTKVLVLSYKKQGYTRCKVYHYASKLFRMLITD